MLARYTMRGLGGPQDIEAGRRWYVQSAKLGSSEAADELAMLDQPLARDSATISKVKGSVEAGTFEDKGHQ